MVRGCRFAFSTPGKTDVENDVNELADNMKTLRSRCTPSPVCPPPSGQAARSVVSFMCSISMQVVFPDPHGPT